MGKGKARARQPVRLEGILSGLPGITACFQRLSDAS